MVVLTANWGRDDERKPLRVVEVAAHIKEVIATDHYPPFAHGRGLLLIVSSSATQAPVNPDLHGSENTIPKC